MVRFVQHAIFLPKRYERKHQRRGHVVLKRHRLIFRQRKHALIPTGLDLGSNELSEGLLNGIATLAMKLLKLYIYCLSQLFEIGESGKFDVFLK